MRCQCCVDTPKGLCVVMTNPKNRHSLPVKRSPLLFREILIKTEFSIESPHKPLLLAQPRWRQVSHMITRHFSSHFNTRCPVHTATRDLCSCMLDLQTSIPKRRRQNTTNSKPNVPLQTRGHALAGISGMLRSLAGAQGAFTSRGAKPKGLNLMLLGLIIL